MDAINQKAARLGGLLWLNVRKKLDADYCAEFFDCFRGLFQSGVFFGG